MCRQRREREAEPDHPGRFMFTDADLHHVIKHTFITDEGCQSDDNNNDNNNRHLL